MPFEPLIRRFAFTIACLFGGLAAFGDAGPVAPEDSLALIRVPAGLRVELVAAEPLVIDPVALAFDTQGHLFVVENPGYPTGPPEGGKPMGKVIVLADSSGDGQYDTRHVFADGLDFPNGVMVWREGILVTDAPHIYYMRDRDGDMRADVREIWLTGFALGASTQLRVSHPALALDNWIYLTNGLSGGDVYIPDRPQAGVVRMGGTDLRFDPFSGRLETCAGRAQFGLTFDDYGRRFVCSNRDHIQHVVLEASDLARNPQLSWRETVAEIPEHGGAARLFPISDNITTAYSHEGTFTAACGLVIYRGTALPEEYLGNGFVCDPTGNLVHRDVLFDAGGTFVARRGHENAEFLASTDNWFRPVFLANGPDGALYVCDMYRKTIEHPRYLAPEIAAVTDFESGNDRGRIYRVTADDAEVHPAMTFDDSTPGAIAGALSHPDGWHRDTAHRLLLEAQNPALAPALRELVVGAESPIARIHALRLLEGLRVLEADDVRRALRDASPRVREQGALLARTMDGAFPDVFQRLVLLADDSDARVRFAAALTLGDAAAPENVSALARIAAQMPDDIWTQSAALSGSAGHAADFARIYVKHAALDHPRVAEVVQELGRLVAMTEDTGQTVAVSSDLLKRAEQGQHKLVLAGITGVASGIQRNAAFSHDGPPLDRLARAGDDALREALDALARDAAGTASDDTAANDARIAAIEFLGYAGFDRASPALASLLGLGVPEPVQVAAVQALGRIDDRRVADFLLEADRWRALIPAVRTAAVNVLFDNSARMTQLLDALEAGVVEPWAVNPVRRSQLQRHPDETVRKRATAMFAAAPGADRLGVYEGLKPVLGLTPDAANGHAVFRNLCATCHVFKGEGHVVGPDLSDLTLQQKDPILLSIVAPNLDVTAGYENYVIDTVDGESYSGILASEDGVTVTLRQALGAEHTVPREDIERMYTSPLSLMPEELELGMSHQELRDLIGFLRGEDPAYSGRGE